MDQPDKPSEQQSNTQQVARDIARQLQETNLEAIEQIGLIVQRLGVEKAQEFLQETLKTEAEGGLLVQDGSRRRTSGGTFFYLVRGKVSRKDRWAIWPHLAPKPKPPPPPAFEWKERLKIVPKLFKRVGESKTVKITLIGRPGRIVEKGEVVLTSMQGSKAPSLPKGLPPVPTDPTTYVVFIAQKQWKKVARAIKDPQDVLIVEGYPVLDKRLRTVTVFTQSVTTKLLQAAKREAQQTRSK
jgi:hypothetical protein